MDSAHQFSSKPDRGSTTDVPFTLHTACSAIPVVSERWGVDVQRFQGKSSQGCQSTKNCLKKWRLVCLSYRQIVVNVISRVLRLFCVARIRLLALSSQILYRNSTLMIAPRFTHSFTEMSVILCYQVTNFSGRGTASPMRLLQRTLIILFHKAYFAILVFWQKTKNTMLPWFWCHIRRTFRIWVLRKVCGQREAFPWRPDCQRTPPTIQQDLANGRPNLDCHSSFLFWLWSYQMTKIVFKIVVKSPWGTSVTGPRMNGLKISDEAAINNALDFARTPVGNILYLLAVQVLTGVIRVDPTLHDNYFIYSIRSTFILKSIVQAAKIPRRKDDQ